MSNKILILSDDKNNINYHEIISYYSLDILNMIQLRSASFSTTNYLACIIDICEPKQNIYVAKIIRERNPSIPLLFIIRSEDKFEHNSLHTIDGFGPIKIFNWRSNYSDSLFCHVQALIRPEYPNTLPHYAIVIPIYNESKRFNHVKEFVMELQRLIENGYLQTTIYFINDGSIDDSSELINKYYEMLLKETRIIHRIKFISNFNLDENTKKAGTYITGLKDIEAQIYIFADADNSFVIEDIAKMINIIDAGYYDMIVGTKDFTVLNRSISRHIISFLKRVATTPFLPKGVIDSQTGLKVLNNVAAKEILPYLNISSGLAIDLEMLYIAKKRQLRVLQIPVQCIEREGSHIHIIRDSFAFIKIILLLIKKNFYFPFSYKKKRNSPEKITLYRSKKS